MKKSAKLSIALAASLLLGTLAGCGGSGKQGTETKAPEAGTTQAAGQDSGQASEKESEKESENEAPPAEVKELTFFNRDGQEDPWTDPVALELTKKTGIKLKTSYPLDENDETIDLMIAEQKYPDMIYAKGGGGKLIEAGALINLEPLIDEYGPNIKKMYGEEFDKLRHSPEDRSIYQLSSYGVGNRPYTTSGVAQIQWDVLKQNDYKIPKTLADFEKMIKDYLAANPKTEDGQDRIGLTLSTADWHWYITLSNPSGFIGEAQPDNGQYLVDENGKATYKFRSDKVREYMKWLNRMYQEGILDPDFATQTHEDYIAKIATGRVVAITDADWDYADAEKILRADGKLAQTYAPLPITLEADQKCAALMYQGLTTGWGVGITTSCEDPVAAIKFLDYIASDEGQVLVNWGIEGVNYTVENGKRIINPEDQKAKNEDPDYGKKTGVGFHASPFPTYGNGVEDPSGNTYTTASRDNVIKEYHEEQKAALKAWGVELLTDIFPQPDEFKVPKYSALWAYATPNEYSEINTQLDEIAWSSLVAMIIDKPENFDAAYDKMVQELESVDMAKAEKIISDIIAERIALVDGK